MLGLGGLSTKVLGLEPDFLRCFLGWKTLVKPSVSDFSEGGEAEVFRLDGKYRNKWPSV